MGAMDIKTLTQQLIDSGYSQGALAREITARGVPCSQPTIWRILRGTDPSYSIGDTIRRMHEEKCIDTAA